MMDAPRFRVPSITAEVGVDLSDFDDADIIEYVRSKNLPGLGFTPEDFERIEMLSICGQSAAARELALQIVSEKIGRAL